MEQGEIPYNDTPDSLQDLCIFYCTNNLDVLIRPLNNCTSDSEGAPASLSYLVSDKILDYYTRCCIPSVESQKCIDLLIQNSERCSDLYLKRRLVFSSENLKEFGGKKIDKLEMSFLDDDDCYEITDALCQIVENNITNLSCVNIFQDCEESVTTGLLNILGGREYDADTGKIDWRGFGRLLLMKMDQKDVDGMVEVLKKGSEAAAAENQKGNELGQANVSCSDTDADAEQIGPNLKSFSYEQLSTSMHPNLEPASSYGWFYMLFSKILDKNPNIQSFSLMSLISNPIEWFLSQPHLPALQNLQSLTLSMEHMLMYGTDTESLKIPYTETFFENLPVLKSLRHLSITYCVTEKFEDDISDEDKFHYTDEQVAAFIESIKKMPQIKVLDISGTNLHKIIGHQDYTECRDHCMPGFEGRQFEFLGLYDTEACKHEFIPALSVSGNKSIEQLIAAFVSLQINRFCMSKVLEEIHDWLVENQPSPKISVSLINGFTAYLSRFGELNKTNSETFEEDNIYDTLDCLYLLMCNEDIRRICTTKQKRLLLERLMVICHSLISVRSWRYHNEEKKNQIVKLALKLFFELEKTVTYSYRFEQYIQVLLGVFNSSARDQQKMLSLHLLHAACRFSQEYKEIAGGKMKVVENLLSYIDQQFTAGVHDNQMLHKVWSILWTLTDDVATNCAHFVEKSGCRITKSIIETVPVQIVMELGHHANLLSSPKECGFTHDVTVYVRGEGQNDISNIVESVTFDLPVSYACPKRVCQGPPFEVSERVQAGFSLPINIHFSNQDEPKKVRFEYDLLIPPNEGVNRSRLEKMSFHKPNKEFKEKIIKAGGYYIFANALLRKISGAMSNVAENKYLRPKLMTQELVDLFRGMLKCDDDSDRNDVSSHAAAFLIMLAADGPEAWTLSEPSRDVILEEIQLTIMKWNINVSRGVRFRTLKPILEQIENYSTPVAQLWGAWLVCHLVIVKPIVYCKLLKDENGLEIITNVLGHVDLREDTAGYLRRIMEQTTLCLNTNQDL